MCIEICPEVFKWNDEKALAYTNPIPDDVQQTCQEAADACPSAAITIEVLKRRQRANFGIYVSPIN